MTNKKDGVLPAHPEVDRFEKWDLESAMKEIQEENKEKLKQEEIKEPELIRGLWTEEEWLTPITQGGPTRQEIEEWKDRYKDVYFTAFDGETFIWRTLARPEYREIIRNTDLSMLDREEVITDKCVLFPRGFSCSNYTESRKAGVPSLLSEMIMDKSGFVASSAPVKL